MLKSISHMYWLVSARPTGLAGPRCLIGKQKALHTIHVHIYRVVTDSGGAAPAETTEVS